MIVVISNGVKYASLGTLNALRKIRTNMKKIIILR